MKCGKEPGHILDCGAGILRGESAGSMLLPELHGVFEERGAPLVHNTNLRAKLRSGLGIRADGMDR